MTKQSKILEKIENGICDVYSDIQGLSNDELLELIRRCERLTTTNCGWAVYRGSKIIKDLALGELNSNKQTNETPR